MAPVYGGIPKYSCNGEMNIPYSVPLSFEYYGDNESQVNNVSRLLVDRTG